MPDIGGEGTRQGVWGGESTSRVQRHSSCRRSEGFVPQKLLYSFSVYSGPKISLLGAQSVLIVKL